MKDQKQLGEEFVALLKTDADFISEMNGRISPLYADQGTPFPFCTYAFGVAQEITKDGGKSWPLQLSLCYDQKSYSRMLVFEKKLETLFKNAGYEVLEPDPVFVDENSLAQVRNMNLSINNY